MIDHQHWDQLRYHEQQSKLWRSKARLVSVLAGRGSGKTTIARRRVAAYLAVKKPHPNPMYFYALPTYKQARRVAWKHIVRLVPKQWLAEDPKHDMIIRTKWGSELHVVGLDVPERLEGDQWDGGVVDEASDQKPGWWKSLRPAMSHRKGWIWEIGVPKRGGKGARDFRNRMLSDEWEAHHWTSDSVLPAEEIEAAKRDLSLKDYREQYCATWETAGGSAFHAFDEQYNVRQCHYRHDRPIYLGCDFNVNPMAWVLAHIYDDKRIEVFDELYLADTNTKESLNSLWSKYQHHKGGFVFHGDAAAKNRHTSASKSDYIQIHNDARFKALVRFPKANPPIKDRLASCNAMFQNAAGAARIHINPACVHLIDDLAVRGLDSTGKPDDAADVGHITDGLGYLVYARFPMTDTKVGKVSITTSTPERVS